MITSLRINNYRGIEKEAYINAKASNKIKRESRECAILDSNKKFLKKICIIGCNGSGKTSVLSAINTLQAFISFPFRKTTDKENKLPGFIKQMNEEELKEYLIRFNTLSLGEQNINRSNEQTEIEIEMYVPKRDDNISGFYTYKIIYDNKYDKKGVLLEKLDYRPKYEKRGRINLSKNINIIESQIGISVLYENNTINKKNLKYIKYYKSFLDELLNHTICIFDNAMINIRDEYENNKDILIKLANIADDKIVDITIDENDPNRNVLFWNENGNSLYYSQLSDGTRKIIVVGAIMINALENNNVVLIDEIESNLHPKLVDFLISLFSTNSPSYKSQLIFNTHDPIIAFAMENDQLYFINNHKNEYLFTNITNAIRQKMISKDQSRYKAWLDDLLIKNPDKNQINNLINELSKIYK